MKLRFEADDNSGETFDMEVTEEQAAALQEVATKTGKTVEQVVIEMIRLELSSSEEVK